MTTPSDKVMSAASYVGATTSVISGLTLTDWGIIVGIFTALITFAANQWWQARKDSRDAAIQKAADQRAQRLFELELERFCGAPRQVGEMPSCDIQQSPDSDGYAGGQVQR